MSALPESEAVDGPEQREEEQHPSARQGHNRVSPIWRREEPLADEHTGGAKARNPEEDEEPPTHAVQPSAVRRKPHRRGFEIIIPSSREDRSPPEEVLSDRFQVGGPLLTRHDERDTMEPPPRAECEQADDQEHGRQPDEEEDERAEDQKERDGQDDQRDFGSGDGGVERNVREPRYIIPRSPALGPGCGRRPLASRQPSDDDRKDPEKDREQDERDTILGEAGPQERCDGKEKCDGRQGPDGEEDGRPRGGVTNREVRSLERLLSREAQDQCGKR